MGPQGFKKMDKRHFHVNDVADVIEWFAYRESRDQEALRVIKSLRNGYNTQKSMIKSFQQRDKVLADRALAAGQDPLGAGTPGVLESVEQPSESAQDEAIISELQELIDTEREEALEKEEVERTDENGDVDTAEYSIFFVKGTPRFKKGSVMVKAIDVPEAVKETLLKEANGGEG